MSRRSHSLLDLNDLARQISALRHDVAGVSRSVSRSGAHTAHDFSDQLWHAGEAVAHQLGHSAKVAGRAVKSDPVPAVVAVAGFALFLNLVLGRKRG